MVTYITLLRFTQKGIENIKESPARLDAAKQAFQSMGAELKDFYLVTGAYDAVVISEVPDDETVAKLLLSIGKLGNVRTETLRAFTEDEYRKIISAIP
ncbi:MAG: GYD domain-containing protein [Candidatus Aminicenantes bacterium]|nr:GYD domain-containing protein [Candidatus Aminicenantes bacterium]